MRRASDYFLPDVSNPLVEVNWPDVRMISIDRNTGTLRILLQEGDPLTFAFGSAQRMDDSMLEWMRANDPLLKD